MVKTSRNHFCTRFRDITNNVEYLGTRESMNFKIKSTDSYHIVSESERIDLIAYRYYGDCNLWWVIADANNIINPLRLTIGQRLRIPAKSTVYAQVMRL